MLKCDVGSISDGNVGINKKYCEVLIALTELPQWHKGRWWDSGHVKA